MNLYSLILLGTLAVAGAAKLPSANVSFVRTGHVKRRDLKRLDLMVFYDALCPASINFFMFQLEPLYKLLNDYIHLDLVPYGKITRELDECTGLWKIKCPHGPDECRFALIHACLKYDEVLSYYESAEFRMCLMRQPVHDDFGACERELRLPPVGNRILQCVASDSEGLLKLTLEGECTDRFQKPLEKSPTVLIDQKYDPMLQITAITDLKGLVCRLLKYEPQQCKDLVLPWLAETTPTTTTTTLPPTPPIAICIQHILWCRRFWPTMTY